MNRHLRVVNTLSASHFQPSLRSIAEAAFRQCENLESVIIPEGVEEIGEQAFLGCKNLKSITLPASLRRIGRRAFARCENLESVIIPEGVEEILLIDMHFRIVKTLRASHFQRVLGE